MSNGDKSAAPSDHGRNGWRLLSHLAARAFLFISVSLLGVLALWRLLAMILRSNRGLDVTDEGLYLLAADPPNGGAAWGFPFGWHTSPLFRFVDYDISAFRTLGAVVLVLCSGLLGWASVAVAMQHGIGENIGGARRRVLLASGVTAGAIGCLLYYASMLRTPSYNWVNLVGITIGASGYLLIIERVRSCNRSCNRFYRDPVLLGLSAVGAFGLFYTIPAKPSSAPLLLVAGFLLWATFLSLNRALQLTAGIVLFLLLWISAARLVGVWPVEFIDVFGRGLRAPTPSPSQTTGRALWNVAQIPLDLIRVTIGSIGLRAGRPGEILIAAAACAGCAILVGLLQSHGVRKEVRLVAKAAVVIALFACAGRLLSAGISFLGARSVRSWGFEPLTVAGLILLLALLITTVDPPRAVKGKADADDELHPRGVLVKRLVLALFLASLPFVFAFGTANGLIYQASVAAGVLAIGMVAVIVGGVSSAPRRPYLSVIVVLLLAGYVSVTLLQGYHRPYGIAPLEDQRISFGVGPEGHRLLLDEDLSAVLSSLAAQATENGWAAGTPMVGLELIWSTTVPYVLGARVPDSLMLTLFGFPASVSIAQYNLSNSTSEFPWNRAWILTTAGGRDGDVRLVADALGRASGRAFPADYECVARSATIELWKPSAPMSSAADRRDIADSDCPEPLPSESAYSARAGWQPS